MLPSLQMYTFVFKPIVCSKECIYIKDFFCCCLEWRIIDILDNSAYSVAFLVYLSTILLFQDNLSSGRPSSRLAVFFFFYINVSRLNFLLYIFVLEQFLIWQWTRVMHSLFITVGGANCITLDLLPAWGACHAFDEKFWVEL